MEENDILRRLRDLPAGDIYIISPREYFLRGFEYYRDKRLLRFHWSGDNSILTAFVMGNRVYPVKFSVINNRLDYECNCPAWTPHSHCKHVICSMLTIRNILNPAMFVIGNEREQYRRILSEGLLRNSEHTEVEAEISAAVPEYALIMGNRRHGGAMRLDVEVNGDSLSGMYSKSVPRYAVPSDLRGIVRDGIYYADHGDMLLAHLKKYGDTYPLF